MYNSTICIFRFIIKKKLKKLQFKKKNYLSAPVSLTKVELGLIPDADIYLFFEKV